MLGHRRCSTKIGRMDELCKEKGRDEETSLQSLKALDDLSEKEIYLHAFLLVQGLKEP